MITANEIKGPRSWQFDLALLCLYGLAYGVFFQLAALMHGSAGFSLWYPAAGVRFALIFIFGWRVGFKLILVELIVQGLMGVWNTAYADPVYLVLGIAAPSFVYTCWLWALEKLRYTSRMLSDLSHIIWFCIAAVAAPALTAPFTTWTLILDKQLDTALFAEAAVSFWIGDFVGILLIAPLVLLVVSAYLQESSQALGNIQRRRFVTEFLVALAFIWVTFGYTSESALSLRWFPLVLPLVFIALRYGFAGAALVVLCLNSVAVFFASDMDASSRFDLQAFLALISFLGLLLGGVMTAREQAEQHSAKQMHATAHMDRMNIMGNMAAQIIHELSQPTSITSLYAKESAKQLEKGNYQPQQVKEAIDRIAAHTGRLNDMIASMKQFASKGEMSRKPSDTGKLLAGVQDLIAILAKSNGVTVVYETPTDLAVHVDEIQMQQAIMNLVKNAVEAMEQTTEKQLAIRVFEENDRVCISIKDSGPGLPADFELGTSTKADGMGMGLVITETIIQAHDGLLKWASPNEAVIIL